jgi:phage terminase small subunit
MGNWNSGRRPHSTALKVMRGNPGKRALNTREPHPPRPTEAFDTPPPLLADNAIAVDEWRRLAPLLREAGMVSEADGALLVALCQQWARYLEAHAAGRTGRAGRGRAGAADKALTHCLHLWRELGLTPSSRSRIVALPEVAPKSKWRELA